MAILGGERVGEAFSFHRCFTEGGTELWCFIQLRAEFDGLAG
jgi:hypothetical protein